MTVLHLPAGGEIGRRPAPVDQLFLVVAGSGSVNDDDGDWHPIKVGQAAAVWIAGEQHTTRTDETLIAIVIEMSKFPLTR